jgi:hypothetical protein
MAQPPQRGLWANSPSSQVNQLSFSTNGNANSTLDAISTVFFNRAHALLTRTTPGAVQPHIQAIPGINIGDYRVWFILDVAVVDEIQRVFAVAPVRNSISYG